MEYFFKASKPLKFNIHYHVGKDIFYPLEKENVPTLKGTFYPKKQQKYCLMWANPHAEIVNLAYDFKVTKK